MADIRIGHSLGINDIFIFKNFLLLLLHISWGLFSHLSKTVPTGSLHFKYYINQYTVYTANRGKCEWGKNAIRGKV